MKKVRILLVLLMVFGLSAPSFALFKIGAAYTGYSQGQGMSASLEFPLIPLLPTTFYITQMNKQNVDLPPVTYGGKSFAGSVEFTSLVGELQIKTPLSFMGVSFGVNGLFDVIAGKDGSGEMVALPGNGYAGMFGEYTKDLLPFISGYAQLGYLVKVLDGEKTINDKIEPVEVNLKDIDKSGLFYRAGLTIGF
ncbi:MAG: hypothetical protein DKM50_02230 [Candidatus Margulisiibacteriota bacterium]|nr:MAG: hypothetical protein A2X43_06685 [Candidatus Margulisbacteria bacterium GWD2_39_127]OGI05294.1 MAG: hypothetical protein A2X42_03800 [Candidatus Margulisbacteria bacterium GWF2_38_17]OGI10847.1 MAG: hypothetical protein A2X41_05675 [Candidatus Margulisbacteria bacterium GWE2_39_32]PZM83533.1 MAG: hypothetical protein DKM50_02230 [Candidatus Margulisiibacteriota bacterium]HAR64289.1 hypothetical protein [Candidatus Margulisiibacteriota bacterium]